MTHTVWDITFVGLVMVFTIFVILYIVFYLLKYVTAFSERRKVYESVYERVSEDEDEVAAIIAAISVFMNGSFRIVSMRRKKSDRGWVVWRKKRKGVRREWLDDTE